MPKPSIFKVYLSQPLRGEFALVLVTGQRETHHFISEYFIFIHAKEKRKYCKRFTLENAHWFETEFKRTIEDECESALVAAKAELDGYILEKYETTEDTFWGYKLFDLQPIPEIRLLTYWMQGLFDEEYNFMFKWTNCDPLREYLPKIIQSPKFKDMIISEK